MSEIAKFIKLTEELNHLNKENLVRESILLLGLHSEYLVNEFLRMRFRKDLEKINSEDIKLKILLVTGVFAETEHKTLDLLRKVRNRYAHDLEINEEAIKDMMKKATINWAIPKETVREIEEQYLKRHPSGRFSMACLTKIQFLFSKLSLLKNEKEIMPKLETIISLHGVRYELISRATK